MPVVGPAVVPPVAHAPRKILLLSSVTAPSPRAPASASSRPSMVAPVVAEIEVRAMMVPTNVVLVPSVAELPTCQYTLHGEAPLTKHAAVGCRRQGRAIWNTQTALGLPPASRVSVPVIAAELFAL